MICTQNVINFSQVLYEMLSKRTVPLPGLTYTWINPIILIILRQMKLYYVLNHLGKQVPIKV